VPWTTGSGDGGTQAVLFPVGLPLNLHFELSRRSVPWASTSGDGTALHASDCFFTVDCYIRYCPYYLRA
jgi:hypothetical protein